MSIGTTIFNAQWTGLASARASLRFNKRTVVERCLCGAVSTARMETEQGTTETVGGSVKILLADMPVEKEKAEGAVVEFAWYGSTDWKPYRISGISETDGVLSLIIEAEFA